MHLANYINETNAHENKPSAQLAFSSTSSSKSIIATPGSAVKPPCRLLLRPSTAAKPLELLPRTFVKLMLCFSFTWSCAYEAEGIVCMQAWITFAKGCHVVCRSDLAHDANSSNTDCDTGTGMMYQVLVYFTSVHTADPADRPNPTQVNIWKCQNHTDPVHV